ncbi:MAG: hypothetical protein ACRDKU_01985, partial [Gaiellaceae bacterium]
SSTVSGLPSTRLASRSSSARLRRVQACGFDLPLELVPRDDSADEQLRKNAVLSPERRVQRLLQARAKAGSAA